MPSRRPPYLFLCLLCWLCTGFGPPVLTESDNPRQPWTIHQIRALRQLPMPHLTAASALLVDMPTGEVLYAQDEHKRWAPASLTKIVTALVALQRGRQDQPMLVRGSDLQPSTAAGLRGGEELNMRQLLFALLIPSDNAASMTIARELAGDVETFVGWMNELVTTWGLENTHFANPHGLDDENGYTTAWDMAIIARQAMQDPVFADIVGRHEAVVAGRHLESTNKLLNTYPGTIGVKTGTTGQAGENLITMVDRPEGRAMTVVLGSEDRFSDTRLLMDYYYSNYAELRIDLPESLQNRYLDESGTWREFGLREPVTLLIHPWQRGTASFYRRITNIAADPDPDEPIGVLEISLNGRYLTEVPLYVR
ncbi:MAG TPA: D-alanyl-D-alanine carboxypeptidase [Chloroflexi bacterium]|jgi:D-alanyl-D-alanine carboxypeptidase (penicillin-binding protein 5/6)|nr:D-alanyl-D-alanine carboxypeptidase [Chloroflexota bacterium]